MKMWSDVSSLHNPHLSFTPNAFEGILVTSV